MKEQTKVDEFKVGDIVWCLVYGKGEVSSIMGSSQDYTYPVEVCFAHGDGNWYTLGGKLDEDGNRTLFFSEPKIEARVTRPFVPTLVGKTVILKYFNGSVNGPVTITAEYEDHVSYTNPDNTDWKEHLVAIYEVSSKNLLK